MDARKFTRYTAPEGLLRDRVILITGAGSGIGQALARAAAGLGATVILHGRSVRKLEALYDEIRAAGHPEPAIFPLDLARARGEDYDRLSGAIEEQWGRLDGLVQNAGILGSRTPIEHHDVAEWQRVLHVNLTAPFILCRCLLPLMFKSDDASVIFASSGVGRRGKAYWGAYAVSKFGVEGLNQVLADELENKPGIRVNAVNPGPTRTAMRAAAYPAEDPMQLKTPEEILGVYLYLLGPESRGTSGASFDAQ
ncbi:YciK family oxidoreductase [Thioalkalivibrio sp. XN279]|uniref:YciK family oxidoreductase n=1 Tax=Thioalkalivibrio sp. XN279 TaxID=2714953 RepID=UPI00140A218D|nr:YciK family oxidoreductase [Thioalkalivibrio sp. XN279]NHA14529.1 YciK family oxidoreductase [Thioalkalivibrio sp. XN279]